MFNTYIYGGEQVIDSEKLEELDTDTSGILEVGDVKESIKGSRDVIKIAKIYQGIEYAILAIENQEGIHYGMPIRVMGYDHYTYNKQYQDKRNYYRKNKIQLRENEFISGIRKSDRFLPVITLVLYYGEEDWDGPICLYDMLEISDKIKKYVNDYQLNIIQVKDNNLQFRNQNNKDLFEVMSIIYDIKKSREQRREMLRQYEENRKIDESVVEVVSAITNLKISYNKAGDRKVCTLWDEVREEGREEGLSLSREAIIEILEDIGCVAPELKDIIGAQKDKNTLKKWIKIASKVHSIEEFENAIKEE